MNFVLSLLMVHCLILPLLHLPHTQKHTCNPEHTHCVQDRWTTVPDLPFLTTLILNAYFPFQLLLWRREQRHL